MSRILTSASDTGLDVFHAVRALDRMLSAEFDRVDGPTLSQYIVLDQVERTPRATQSALAVTTGVDRSTLSDILGRMSDHGWIMRRRNADDPRAYEVRITAEGSRQLRAARARAAVAADRLVAAYPPIVLLSRLVAHEREMVRDAVV